MSTVNISTIVRDANKKAATKSAVVEIVTSVTSAFRVNTVTITPQSAPVGTEREVVVVASGGVEPYEYTLSVPGHQPIVNSTGVFTVVI